MVVFDEIFFQSTRFDETHRVVGSARSVFISEKSFRENIPIFDHSTWVDIVRSRWKWYQSMRLDKAVLTMGPKLYETPWGKSFLCKNWSRGRFFDPNTWVDFIVKSNRPQIRTQLVETVLGIPSSTSSDVWQRSWARKTKVFKVFNRFSQVFKVFNRFSRP